MAKQEGIIKLRGNIDGIAFYHSQDGYLARKQSRVNKERIASDPAYARTRENGREFKEAAVSGKLLRDAIRPMLRTAADNRAVSRLLKIMSEIKNLDTVSARGDRNVATAIVGSPAQAVLRGFNFNNRSLLGTVLAKPFTINTGTGVVLIPGLVPIKDMVFPRAATHVAIRGAWAKVDFAGGVFETYESNTVNIPLNNVPSNVVLTPSNVPTGTGTDVFFLLLEFFQQVNGTQYPMNNGEFNCLSVIEVA